jgi:hypothetical protein
VKHILSPEQLRERCARWQNQLRLNNWRIAVSICRRSSFNDSDAQGEVDFGLSSGKAIIRILDPVDYPDTPFEQDMEITLVHELLHLCFAPFTPNESTLSHTFMENTIEMLAQTLVEIDRTR